MSVYSLLTTGSAVGEKLCYHDIPEKLDPFDNEAFMASSTAFYVGVTNLETGEGEYPQVTDLFKQLDYLRASASMPYVSRIVTLDGKPCLDGGIADSVPLAAFERMGYARNVVVLTKEEGFKRREATTFPPLNFRYRKYPRFLATMARRVELCEAEGALHTARRGRGARLRRPPQPQAGDRAAGARPGASQEPLRSGAAGRFGGAAGDEALSRRGGRGVSGGLLALIIAAWLVLLFWALAWACYALAFRRHENEKTLTVFDEKRYGRFAPAMRAGQGYYRGLAFEEAEIASFDGLRLHARVCGAEAGKPLLLLLHGWRSSAARDFGCVLEFYRAQGFGLILVDQRAHGKSGGKTISFGVHERRDCLAWARWAEERYHPTAMYLDGISMGAATVLMASEFDLPASVRGIIADCGYTSPRDILKKVIRQCHLPVAPIYFLVRLGARVFGRFDPEAASAARALEQCRVPVLFIHGEADGFVPCDMSRENYARCAAPKALVTVPGADHGFSYLVDREGVEAALRRFFRETDAPLRDGKAARAEERIPSANSPS